MKSTAPRTTRRSRHDRLRARIVWTTLACLLLVSGAPARAQDDAGLGDVLGSVGVAEVQDVESEKPADLAPDEGTVVGSVIDAETGFGVPGATVILLWPAPAGGGEPRQEVAVADGAGEFRFPRVPAGTYRLNFIKSGYRVATLNDFGVTAGQVNVADFPLPPKQVDTAGAVLELDEFVVEASMVGDMMNEIDLRMESDSLVDLMGTEDLAKFAATDVGDALKRVSGVNVVQGRFAVIRGLEDRYSSTLFNSAPIPSADPLRQSVQLDLFPSDIVSNIVVAKTFEAATPGNSGAGSIDIDTMGYPDDLTVKLSLGTGFNENAADSFLEYRQSSPVAKFNDGTSVIESDLNLSIGGRETFWNRELRLKIVLAREIDYETAIGTEEQLEPRISGVSRSRIISTGDLAFKRLTVSDGLFDFEQSRRSEQYTYFGSLGMDVDPDGDHRVDFSAFHTEKDIEDVQRLDDGFIPGFDYAGTPPANYVNRNLYQASTFRAVATLSSILNQFREEVEKPEFGPLSILPMVAGRSIVQDRELSVFQLNGEHDLHDLLEGLEFEWATNYARTRQDETAFELRYWYEPYAFTEFDEDDLPVPAFPPQVSDFAGFGPGSWRTNLNEIIYYESLIDEDQVFARGDFTYEVDPASWLATRLRSGFWFEKAERTVTVEEYLLNNPIEGRPGVVDGRFVEGVTEGELGTNTFFGYGLEDLGVPTRSELDRQIIAGYFDAKLTLWDDVDVIGGVRVEQIDINARNRPFTGQCLAPGNLPSATDPTRSGLGCPDGFLPRIIPTRYLFLDRFDNPFNPFFREDPSFARTGVFSDVVLNIDLPTQDANGIVDILSTADMFRSLTGEIDELEVFPMASVAYRPVEGLTVRGAYSETAARPSFRELSYYASIVPGIPDRIVGNPFLQLSNVQSVDGRVEYFWGDVGDLLAVSAFYKTIANPIELVILRDFSVAGAPLFEGPFRVYRNNENTAELKGIELEARVNLGNLNRLGDWTIPGGSFLEYLTIGGNYTYIDAEIARSPFELQLANEFYQATEDDVESGQILATSLPLKRRLFNQPEWTANADITFDQPDWGTTFTLSVFAISDVLNAAGGPALGSNGDAEGFTLDEYIAGFYQLDMVVGQSFEIPRVPGRWTVRTSIKNLTDSERGLIYDPAVTTQVYQWRTFTVGRDYSFTLQYQTTF